MRDLKQESKDLANTLLEGHHYSFHMFRGVFIRNIENDKDMISFWYEDGDFKNMRLYKYLAEIGYHKHGTILEKKH